MSKDVDNYIDLVNSYVSKVNTINDEEQKAIIDKPIEEFVYASNIDGLKKLNINTFGDILLSYERNQKFPYLVLSNVVEYARGLGWNGKTLIIELELTVSACSILNRAGIHYLDQLLEMSTEDIFNIPRLGRKNYESIIRKIGESGYSIEEK